jgi:ABC-type antimicrobial peptide transport system permease subunit
MPTLTMQKKLLGTDYVLGVAIKVKDVSRIDETKEDLTYIMREQHNIENPDEDDFEVSTIAETIQMVNNIINGINAFLIALALVSLVVGGVGIMNIMYVSVSERVFEIGLRMALGARKKDILYQFLAEAVLLTIAGGVLGLVLGLFICLLFNNLSSALGIGIYAVISISSIVFAFIFAGALGLVSGIYPAIKASNLDPITALRK